MQLSLILDLNDTKQAVCEWLKTTHNIVVVPDEIEPVVATFKDGDFEDTTITHTQTGWQVKPEAIGRIFQQALGKK